MRLSKPIAPSEPELCLRQWVRELKSSREGAATLQHEVIDSFLGLRSQGTRDGWANWSEASVEQLDLLRAHLPTGDEAGRKRVLSDLNKIQVYGEGKAPVGYAEIDRLMGDVFRWCGERPEWIPLPVGYEFWLDVPADKVPPQESLTVSKFSLLSAKIGALFNKRGAKSE